MARALVAAAAGSLAAAGQPLGSRAGASPRGGSPDRAEMPSPLGRARDRAVGSGGRQRMVGIGDSGANGPTAGWLAAAKLEAALRHAEETESRFRTLADCAPVLLWMSGEDGLCDFFNQGW